MIEENWFLGMYLLVAIPTTIHLFYLAQLHKSFSVTIFALSTLSFNFGIILSFWGNQNQFIAREWGDLISITLIMCGLFVKIRESKPVFARFPIYLTVLPLLILIFYPLVVDSIIVKDLLKMTFQGGAIITAILLVSMNQFKYGNRVVLLFTILVFLLSFVLKWIIHIDESSITDILSKLIFTVGIILSSIGLKISLSKIQS